MKRYFLGMAAEYRWRDILDHTFMMGRQSDCDDLCDYLGKRYGGETILCKNGRSALGLALKAYFNHGDTVVVNGFTCYAVYEAIKAAGLTPIFADISKKDLNIDFTKLEKVLADSHARGIIVQNSLGNPADIITIEKLAKKFDLTIIEDMAHCVGAKYADGRECGTVGAGAAFSFGKDKVIDAISGGAVVLRNPALHKVAAPSLSPRPSDHMRARFYPLFGGICRGLTSIHLGGVLMRGLVKIHWVEKSADNRLDFKRKISKFEARSALKQFKVLGRSGEKRIRKFCLVKEREEVLKKLARNGYYFDGLWYKQPVSPERYYKKVHFPENDCPNSVFIAKHILNLPTYYGEQALSRAKQIIKPYLVKGENDAEGE